MPGNICIPEPSAQAAYSIVVPSINVFIHLHQNGLYCFNPLKSKSFTSIYLDAQIAPMFGSSSNSFYLALCYLSLSLCVCVCVHVCICPCVCLSVCLYVCMFKLNRTLFIQSRRYPWFLYSVLVPLFFRRPRPSYSLDMEMT